MKPPQTNSKQNTRPLSDYFRHSVHFCYLLTDEEGQLLFANDCFRKKFPGIASGLAHLPLVNIILAAEKNSCRKMLKKCSAENNVIHTIDLHIPLPDRSYSLVRWEVSSLIYEDDSIVKIQWVGIDMDDIKNRMTSLGTKVGTQPERYKAYELSAGGLWRYELKEPFSATALPDDIIEYCRKNSFLAECNDNMARMYGFEKAEELIGTSLEELMHFSDPVRVENLKSFIQNGFQSTNVETKESDRHGNIKFFLNNMTGIVENGRLVRIWGTQQDITEQRKAEEKISYFAMLMENVSDIIISQDNDFNVVSWNKVAEEVYGYSAGEMIGRKIPEVLHFEFQDISREGFFQIIKTKGIWKGEAYVTNRYGKPLTVLATVTKIRDGAGNSKGYVSVTKDITGRKTTDDLLRRQAVILTNVSDLIMTMDFELTILSWNKKAEEVTGFLKEEVIGKFLGDIVHPDYGALTASQSAKELVEKGFWQGELSFVNKYDVRKHVLHTASYLLDEKGKRIAIIGTGKDITERKKAEEQLRQSELFYRNLIAESLDGIILTDEKGIISFASPSITGILGYSPEEVLGKNTFEFGHPDDVETAHTAFLNEVRMEPKTNLITVRLRKKTGEWAWCITRGHNMLHNPYVGRMVIYFYDDTKRKEAEAALMESQAMLKQQAVILNHVSDVIVTGDMNYVITSWNNIAEELTGITAAEAVGKNYREIIPLDYSPFTATAVRKIVLDKGVWRGETSFTNKAGERKVHLDTISLIPDENGSSKGYLVVGKDITERKQIEEKLQKSESFYRSLIANSLDGIVLTNKYGQITYCSPSVTPLSGYDPKEIIGRNLFEFVHPDDQFRAEDAFMKEMHKQSVLYYIVIRLKHSNGSWVWCSVRGHNFFDDPSIHSMVVYFTDETMRKTMEDQLRESEANFRNLIHNLNLGVVVQNEKSEVLISNKAALDMLGLTEEQLLGTTSFDPRWNVIHEDGTDFPGHTHPVPAAIQTKQPVRDVVMGVHRPVANDRVWLLVNAEPIIDNNNSITGVICSFADITEQKRLSQELIEQEIQKQKLLTQATIDGQEKERLEIGKELHDNISQHLTTTRLYLEIAKEKANGEMMEMISYAHKNVSDIINELRHLSQSLVPPSLGDLGLIESVQDLCAAIGRTHTFQLEFHHRHFAEDGLPENMKLMFFRIIQEQINNIVRHAYANMVLIRLQEDAEEIILTISDNGKGFDPAQHKRGLGFTSIANRVSLFGGKLHIDTAPGKGSTITITIPFIKELP